MVTWICPRCGYREDVKLSPEASTTLRYMVHNAPKRGGFMFEGARPDYERGKYQDHIIDELLAAGAIAPHPDPNKGWVVVRP